MGRSFLARGLGVIATLSLAGAPLSSVAAPRMIKIKDDGSVQDTTQRFERTKIKGKGRYKDGEASSVQDTTSDPALTIDSTSSEEPVSNESPSSGEPLSGGEDLSGGEYLPTVSPTLTPEELEWAGRKWRVNSPADTYPGHDHSIQISRSGEKIRFEVRPDDTPIGSDSGKRRSELSGSIYGDPTRLPNGVSLWGAYSTIHHSWARESKGGGVYGQIHMGEPKGNPALAFRRRSNGNLQITTRSEFEESSVERYNAPLSWNVPHDIVYNIVLHPTNGRLKVWIDGKQVVDFTGGVGHSAADHYWAFGQYFSAWSELSCVSVAEYANHVYPGKNSLLDRVSARPAWPSD